MFGRVNRRRRQPKPETTIDVAIWIDEIEQRLLSTQDRSEILDALAILQRWQFDEMIDAPSRERARLLVRRYTPWPLFGQMS